MKTIPWDQITLPYKEDPDVKFIYEQFLLMRQKKKRPVTEYAQFLHFRKMQESGWTKEMAIAAIEQSIERAYDGIFLPQDYQPKQKYVGGQY